ncbi:unnamed protein product [Symbiodinium sp. KB8]|nr:unnamed protein product [Symbiodinium sp. KB8]
MPDQKGSWRHWFAVGGRLHPLEGALVYSQVFGVLFAPPALKSLFWTNAAIQLMIFLPVVQLPILLTGKMLYVDIGWPSGLVAIGATSLLLGAGLWVRKCLIATCFVLHGGRMALGALVMFGQSSNFTYRFQEDLPRYQYAKHKWVSVEGMPEDTWWLKMQLDSLGQGISNIIILCVPAFLTASNPDPQISWLEWMGFAIWAAAWVFESFADFQKMLFLQECKKLKKSDATLGLAPFDKYFLWSWCRHPNYFGEWCAWVGLAITAFPSLLNENVVPEQRAFLFRIYVVGLIMLPRVLYDCLVHWTGAGPAEHFSSKKRASYREYQEKGTGGLPNLAGTGVTAPLLAPTTATALGTTYSVQPQRPQHESNPVAAFVLGSGVGCLSGIVVGLCATLF